MDHFIAVAVAIAMALIDMGHHTTISLIVSFHGIVNDMTNIENSLSTTLTSSSCSLFRLEGISIDQTTGFCDNDFHSTLEDNYLYTSLTTLFVILLLDPYHV